MDRNQLILQNLNLEQSYVELERVVTKVQADRKLSNIEMELLLYKLLDSVKTYKSAEYAFAVTNLNHQLQELQKQNNSEVKEVHNE